MRKSKFLARHRARYYTVADVFIVSINYARDYHGRAIKNTVERAEDSRRLMARNHFFPPLFASLFPSFFLSFALPPLSLSIFLPLFLSLSQLYPTGQSANAASTDAVIRSQRKEKESRIAVKCTVPRVDDVYDSIIARRCNELATAIPTRVYARVCTHACTPTAFS